MFLLVLVLAFSEITSATDHNKDDSNYDRALPCSPSDCEVSSWSAWSGCSQTCIGSRGHQLRFRTKLTASSCNGLPCPPLTETRTCYGGECTNGGVVTEGKCVCKSSFTGLCCQTARVGWSPWSDWSSCTKTCGTGCLSKRRTCYKGPGANCTGYSVLMKVCNTKPCTPGRYENLGCYKDGKPRALPELVENLRSNIDWWDMGKTVKECAKLVQKKGWKYFGIQFYGECWSGPTAGTTFLKYGKSKGCWNGVGRQGSNYVYKLE